MSATQNEMPNIKMLMFFNASQVKRMTDDKGGNAEKAEWVLLASFIDGMLDTVGPEAQIIDGNEVSYYYTRAIDFDNYPNEKQSGRNFISETNRAKYDSRVSVGHAVYVDGPLNTTGSPRFFGYYLENDRDRLLQLESNLFHAMRTSNEYVWVYNERMNWWGTFGEPARVPNGLEAAIGEPQQTSMPGNRLASRSTLLNLQH